ncbi:MAG: hypothetical protein ACR2HR_01165 [Euzebya sp.]
MRTGAVTFTGAGGTLTDSQPDIVRLDANTIHAVYSVVLPGTDLPSASGVDAWLNRTPGV